LRSWQHSLWPSSLKENNPFADEGLEHQRVRREHLHLDAVVLPHALDELVGLGMRSCIDDVSEAACIAISTVRRPTDQAQHERVQVVGPRPRPRPRGLAANTYGVPGGPGTRRFQKSRIDGCSFVR
jgi:hypothetical protein